MHRRAPVPLAIALLGLAVAAPPAEAQAPTLYHNWATLTRDLQDLVAAHPDIARLHSAGKSVLGLDLWYVEITNFLSGATARPA